MLPFDQMQHHDLSEKLTKILCEKTQNPNPLFFRVQVAFYFSLIASMMRTTIVTHDRGDLPVNMYALNLGTSGSGKGFSTNIIENQVIDRFRTRFLEETFPVLVEQNLPKLALKRAQRKGAASGIIIDPEQELQRVTKEFDAIGELLFSFDSGTSPAVKQFRHKLLMAGAGSMNLLIDEIGSNLTANSDVLTTFLELYDVGRVKTKLIKNTSDNTRFEEIVGETPTNMLLFGTPSTLLNGGKVEEELYSMLETGYGRRCFFGYSSSVSNKAKVTKEEMYNIMTDKGSNQFLEELSIKFDILAEITHFNKRLVMSKETYLTLIEYQLHCKDLAEEMAEHDSMKKAEVSHRYFKVLKLAGAYAFVDNSNEITESHLYSAIKLAEESGQAFNLLLNRDRDWVKLAKYLGAVRNEVTQADLSADLPFYKGTLGQKSEMLNLAIAWGYKNNIIIKKSFSDGIEFLRGEALKETNLEEMILAHSKDIAVAYKNERAPFDKLHILTQKAGRHWISHHLINGEQDRGHRTEEHAIPGFNMVVIDVDGDVPLASVRNLMKNYKYLIYTTKRHQTIDPDTGDAYGDRFRLIMPINYELGLDKDDFKEFMENLYDWLPFEVDTSTNQRARKWMSHDGSFEYNDGIILDALPFIPKTRKNEERKELLLNQQGMDNLERWVMNNIGDGNRNNMLLRYAMILLDGGYAIDQIKTRVMGLNNKIANKLTEVEIMSTIMITVAKTQAKQ